jgi:type VI secretion system secreted protein Hcp
MPLTRLQVPGPGSAGAADVFLHVQTKRAGKVKGEAASDGHVDDIIVTGWHWSLSATSALGSAWASSRRSYSALTVVKQIDQATTALMAALATNDEVKEARLTMRRAGGSQEDYFTIKLQGARITSLQHDAGADGSTRETVGFTFTKVDVEYRPQRSTGLRSGSTSFSDELPLNE